MATFFNATPHNINVIQGATFNPAIRKFVGGQVVREIAPSGTLLNAKMVTIEADPIDGVPTFVKMVEGCDPLPREAMEADVVIVSLLYATAYKEVYGEDEGFAKLYGVSDPVMSDDGKTFRGCLGLQKL